MHFIENKLELDLNCFYENLMLAILTRVTE